MKLASILLLCLAPACTSSSVAPPIPTDAKADNTGVLDGRRSVDGHAGADAALGSDGVGALDGTKPSDAKLPKGDSSSNPDWVLSKALCNSKASVTLASSGPASFYMSPCGLTFQLQLVTPWSGAVGAEDCPWPQCAVSPHIAITGSPSILWSVWACSAINCTTVPAAGNSIYVYQVCVKPLPAWKCGDKQVSTTIEVQRLCADPSKWPTCI